MQSDGSDGFKARHALGYGGRVSCLSGGLGRVSERVGVHRHAVAVCIVGLMVLLAGCSNSPTVVQVSCAPLTPPKFVIELDNVAYSQLTLYWSNGTTSIQYQIPRCPPK